MTRPLVIAHRGHSIGAPEQTGAAYTAAVALGADMIEADVRRTRDGRLVMLHDATVDRTTSGTGAIADLTWDDVRTLDAGSWFTPAFAGERVPLLDELLDLADETGVALCVEVKGETPDAYAELALEVARHLARRNRLERDYLASFDHAALVAAARATPGLRPAPDRLPERGPSAGAALVAQARQVGADVIQHHHADLTAEAVDTAQSAGVAIWAWPPTTPEEIDVTLSLGAQGLMGDDVGALVAAVSAASGAAASGADDPRKSTP